MSSASSSPLRAVASSRKSPSATADSPSASHSLPGTPNSAEESCRHLLECNGDDVSLLPSRAPPAARALSAADEPSSSSATTTSPAPLSDASSYRSEGAESIAATDGGDTDGGGDGGGCDGAGGSGDSFRNVTQMMQMFCDISVDALVIIDHRARMVTFNRAFLDMFGYERYELVGRNVSVIMDARTARHHDHFVQRYRRTRVRRIIGEQRSNLLGRRKDGSLFRIMLWVHEHTQRGSNEPSFFAGAIRDNTYGDQLDTMRALLDRVLPPPVVTRLLRNEDVAERYVASVGFLDLVGYTAASAKMTAHRTVRVLADVFSRFDAMLDDHALVRVKTIGDCYMFCSRHTTQLDAHAANAVTFALRCVDALRARCAERGGGECDRRHRRTVAHNPTFSLRAGVATGWVFAGVVPGATVAWDVWGSTVNVAARLEQHAQPNEVLVCARAYDESVYCMEYATPPVRRTFKGIDGDMDTYTALRLRDDYAAKYAHAALVSFDHATADAVRARGGDAHDGHDGDDEGGSSSSDGSVASSVRAQTPRRHSMHSCSDRDEGDGNDAD